MAENVFITGCTGYLGSHLTRSLLSQGKRVHGLVRETSKFDHLKGTEKEIELFVLEKVNFKTIFTEQKIDTIVHCATDYGRAGTPADQVIRANLHLPTSMLKFALESGVRQFINIDTVLDRKISTYSQSKKEFLDHLIAHRTRLDCVNIMLNHFYGPGEGPGKFVSDMVQKLLKPEPVIELTPGLQERDFTYIDDVVSAFSLISNRKHSFSVGFDEYLVATGRPISIRTFMETLKILTENVATDLRFGALPYRESELMHFPTDISAIQKLGWIAQTNLENGLCKTIQSVKNSIENQS